MSRRICMLSVHTSPLAALGGKETGGMNVYVREVSRFLAMRGWQVDIFTRAQGEGPAVAVDQPEVGCRTIQIVAGPEGPVDRREVFAHLPEFVEGVLRYQQEERSRYDLLFSHYWLSGWVARELRDHWGVPIVHMFHTLGRMKDMVSDDPEQREAENRAEVEQEIMEFADRIVAATPLDREQMLDLYQVDEAKIVVIPCGVNLDLFHPMDKEEARRALGLPLDRRLLLFVGRLDPVKGLNVLLQAMCELMRRNKPCIDDLSLAVIGGDRESHLEAVMNDVKCLGEIRRELGLDDLVIFIGSRSQEVLPFYYSAAEACVMPSLYESFGMVALEAMACGVPVIASKVGGLTFTVRDGETGFLVPERDAKALAEKLDLVLNDDCLRRRLGRRAAQVAQSYSWASVADQLEELYDELMPVLL